MTESQSIERRLAEQLVDDALESGHAVSVNDGIEWVVIRSTDRLNILNAMFSTGNDTLAFWKGVTKMGWVELIYGNGCDVFSDWTDNAATNELLKSALGVANTLFDDWSDAETL